MSNYGALHLGGPFVLAALMLGTVAAAAGVALAICRFEWPTLAASGLILIVTAAFSLKYQALGLSSGILNILSLLSLQQLGYVIGTVIVSRPDSEDSQEHTGNDAQQKQTWPAERK